MLNSPPPNFQQELAKCQRYQIELVTPENLNSYSMIGLTVAQSSNRAYVSVLLPVPLRIKPTATISGTAYFSNSGTWNTGIKVSSVTDIRRMGNGVSIGFLPEGTLTAGQTYVVAFAPPEEGETNSLLLDANL